MWVVICFDGGPLWYVRPQDCYTSFPVFDNYWKAWAFKCKLEQRGHLGSQLFSEYQKVYDELQSFERGLVD